MKAKLSQWFVMGIGTAVLLVTLSSCVPAAPLMTLTEKDNGSQVTLAAGQEVKITLESNITTGFTWEVIGLNTTLLEQIGEPEYKAPQSGTQPLVGAGGSQIFRFKAKTSGQVELKLIYHRIFEKDVPPAKTFLVSLVIK